jgi:NAD(P)-dependent dehydrogenase (short-subunit alcohol dehydrogenase family)
MVAGLITGCGKGIGLACLKSFLEGGAENVAYGISRSLTPDVEKLLGEHNGRFLFDEVDITSIDKVERSIKSAINAIGFPSFVICNAGARSRVSIVDASLGMYRNVLEVNTISQIHIVKKLLDSRERVDTPLSILMISSIVGNRGFSDLSTYGVSKAALEGFVRSSSVELAKDNIRINCLNPGFVRSSYAESFRDNRKELYDWTISQIPMGRWGECSEIASIALFLVSNANSYMTGTVVYCDGGWTSK